MIFFVIVALIALGITFFILKSRNNRRKENLNFCRKLENISISEMERKEVEKLMIKCHKEQLIFLLESNKDFKIMNIAEILTIFGLSGLAYFNFITESYIIFALNIVCLIIDIVCFEKSKINHHDMLLGLIESKWSFEENLDYLIDEELKGLYNLIEPIEMQVIEDSISTNGFHYRK